MYNNSNHTDSAIYYLNQSYTLAASIGVKYVMTDVLNALSDAHGKRKEYQKALAYYKEYTQLKDSLFNESKSKEIGKLEAQYEFEKQQEEERRNALRKQKELELAKQRRDNLQYSGIFVVVLLLFVFVFMSGKFAVTERVAEGLIFFTFLLFFEFMLVLMDPYIENWSSGAPAYKLLFNAILAALIFPAHAFFENTLKQKLLK